MQLRGARKVVKILAYILSALTFVSIYLSLVDMFAEPIQGYDKVLLDD